MSHHRILLVSVIIAVTLSHLGPNSAPCEDFYAGLLSIVSLARFRFTRGGGMHAIQLKCRDLGLGEDLFVNKYERFRH